MRISRNYLTFPFFIPRVYSLIKNWPLYLSNYLLRKRVPTEYEFRDGYRLIDGAGTLTGTIAVVFVRREYGVMRDFRIIVDIGANMGSFAVYAAQSCPDATIYCYEPEHKNYDFLKKNIAINSLEGRIVALQYAVASKQEQREMTIGASPVHSLVPAALHESSRMVNCTTLHDVFEAHGLKRIDLLKMNCEGAEYEIFENCSPSDLERISNIRMEYHNLDGTNRNGGVLRRYFERHGYRIERYTRYRDESGFIWASR